MITAGRRMKIEYAAQAARAFARQLCQSGGRGSLMTFGNTFDVEVPFTGNLGALDLALATLPERLVADIRRRATGEGTRLYDSLADSVSVSARSRDPRHPFVLVDLTDGKDNRSHLFDPERIGEYMARTFTRIPGNFAFLIGVGQGDQIDRQALATIGTKGGFPAVLLDSFDQLRECFTRIAQKVTASITREIVRGPGFTMSSTTPGLHVLPQATDFAFLIDRSGSMAERS